MSIQFDASYCSPMGEKNTAIRRQTSYKYKTPIFALTEAQSCLSSSKKIYRKKKIKRRESWSKRQQKSYRLIKLVIFSVSWIL